MITWSDGMGSRERSPWLLLIKNDKITSFKGETIPGLAVVVGSDYEKNGKWSHTTYRIELAPGVRHIAMMDGWETGRFIEGLGDALHRKTPDTWAELADALGVSVPAAMDYVRGFKSQRTADELDRVDAQLAELEEASTAGETEIVTVSFGNPSRRRAEEGFWTEPKPVPGGGEIRLIDASGRFPRWEMGNIAVDGVRGDVISVRRNGSYYAVNVAVCR